MNNFAQWLSESSVSLTIQTHAWIIPTLQSIHIVAIAVVAGSVLMMALRVLRCAGTDQTLTQTTGRFTPPLAIGLGASVVTGSFQVLGEPPRELLSFSFWLKMSLLLVSIVAILLFRSSVKRNESYWETVLIRRMSTRSFTIVLLLIWALIMVLGRLIAYDSIWGSWSMVPKD